MWCGRNVCHMPEDMFFTVTAKLTLILTSCTWPQYQGQYSNYYPSKKTRDFLYHLWCAFYLISPRQVHWPQRDFILISQRVNKNISWNEWQEEGIDLCRTLIDTDHNAVSVAIFSYSRGKKYLNSEGGSECINNECPLTWQLLFPHWQQRTVFFVWNLNPRKPQFSLTLARVLTVHIIFI